MSTNPTKKGAFSVYLPDAQPSDPPEYEIKFMYTPETKTKSLSSEENEDDVNQQNNDIRAAAFPTQQITINVRLDASTLVENSINQNNTHLEQYGIFPLIVAFEKIAEPVSTSNASSDSRNGRNIPNLELPIVIFHWGDEISYPVKIKNINVTENKFGPNLFPIRAELQIQMESLTVTENGAPPIIESYYNTMLQFRDRIHQIYIQNQSLFEV